MGILTKVGDRRIEASSFSLIEESIPLTSGDTSGQVGSFTVVFHMPADLSLVDVLIWKGRPVEITDSEHGDTLGTVEDVTVAEDTGMVTLTCYSKLAVLNAYNIQTQPFTGTLGDLLEYYFSLAGVTADFEIDPSIASRPVCVVGWSGELWLNLKLLLNAHGCDISLLDSNINVRPVREYTLAPNSTKSRQVQVPAAQLARSVEVYQYQTTAVTNKLVYPSGGWKPELDVITINAGEYLEQTLQLNTSVVSISQPSFQTVVAPGHDSSSVYTVIGDDGLPITYAAWTGAGGSLTVVINPDTTSLTIKITAPQGLPSRAGGELKTYSLALASDASGSRYSTLRIVGTGVAFSKKKRTFRTGVPENRTATQVGITIDNRFMTDLNDVYRAGVRAAAQYAGGIPATTGSVRFTGLEGSDYGKMAGARMWHEGARRWFRIRNITQTPADISFSAEDDLLNGEIQAALEGKTCAEVETIFAGYTCGQVNLRGLPT